MKKPSKARPHKGSPHKRLPLSRAQVIDAALALVDAKGIDALTLRAVATTLGVEAMSLYKHVANKGEILDGLVERVFEEMPLPAAHLSWRAFLFERTCQARTVLLKHRWAPMLIECGTRPSPARLRVNDGIVGALRRCGFTIELAYSTFLALDSYLYGFTLQEIWAPFEPEERAEVVESLRPAISPRAYPHLVEMMNFLEARATSDARIGASSRAGYAVDFEFGLNLLLDGLERAFKKSTRSSAIPAR